MPKIRQLHLIQDIVGFVAVKINKLVGAVQKNNVYFILKGNRLDVSRTNNAAGAIT